MQSISVSSYRDAVSKIVSFVLRRRSMYPDQLSGVEDIFHGHWMAYHELAGIELTQSFNYRFARWLWDKKRIPGDAGWAVAMDLAAEKNGIDPEKVFEDFVNEFLASWDSQTDIVD